MKRLSLFLNRLTDPNALAGLGELAKLEWLFLDYNTLPDISVLARLKKLKQLGLEGSRVKDVSALAELKQLEKLYLSFNPALTKSEINKLQQALPKCDIRHNAKK